VLEWLLAMTIVTLGPFITHRILANTFILLSAHL
jgi:hypothetical protein